MEERPVLCKVSLNVYDLVTANWNSYLYFAGLGVHHSGVVLFGQEFSYGAHDDNSSGIFSIEPMKAPECRFRTTIELGEVKISVGKFKTLLNEMGTVYTGANYHILTQNCNHFSRELCQRLLDKEIPGWVNRLAKSMNYVKCIVPRTFLDTPTGAIEEPSQTYVPYSGTPHKLNEDKALLIDNREDIESRRRLLEVAAMKRFQNGD